MSVWATMMRKAKAMMLRRGPMMLTCRDFDAFILDYLADGLSPAQRRVFELHLRICRHCRSYLDGYRQTVALEKAAFADPNAPVPADVPDDLVKAILAARATDAP